MRFNFFLLKLIASLIYISKTLQNIHENTDQYNLISLGESDFQSYISSNKHFFLFVHSTWCKWSQKFSRQLVKINEYLKYESQPLYIGMYDVTLSNVSFLKEIFPESINSDSMTYPKLFYFEDGKVKDIYNGILNVDSTYLWIKRKIQVSSFKINLMQVFQTKVKFDKNSFIFFGDYSDLNKNFALYNKISKEVQISSFYHTNDNLLFDYLNPLKNFSVGYFKYGTLNSTLSGNLTSENLISFIKNNTLKNFYESTNLEIIEEIFFKRNPAIIFFVSKYDEEYIYYYRVFKLIALEMRFKVNYY